ncbi:hypothetical protein SKAU_G00032560 [Synaphobranchus kaupii]|uniref:Uncharacterized protein n=1 Tax=Synaphobranchus kaupii TaxID=118154 RepID=A0A9Q1GF25_SYNKA|nr:hypothetical protein SKAU_G00032560 [Synaphobranchus kaupii]
MRHQKRLLSHFRQKSIKLEEVINKMKQEMQIMNKKLVEQNAYIVKLDTAFQSVKAAQQSSRIAPALADFWKHAQAVTDQSAYGWTDGDSPPQIKQPDLPGDTLCQVCNSQQRQAL